MRAERLQYILSAHQQPNDAWLWTDVSYTFAIGRFVSIVSDQNLGVVLAWVRPCKTRRVFFCGECYFSVSRSKVELGMRSSPPAVLMSHEAVLLKQVSDFHTELMKAYRFLFGGRPYLPSVVSSLIPKLWQNPMALPPFSSSWLRDVILLYLTSEVETRWNKSTLRMFRTV